MLCAVCCSIRLPSPPVLPEQAVRVACLPSNPTASQSRADPTGEHLRAIRAFLNSPEGLCIEFVWYSYSCMPLPRLPERWQHVAHTRLHLAALEMQLPSVSSLFLGCSVLALMDTTYLKRFWTQYEVSETGCTNRARPCALTLCAVTALPLAGMALAALRIAGWTHSTIGVSPPPDHRARTACPRLHHGHTH